MIKTNGNKINTNTNKENEYEAIRIRKIRIYVKQKIANDEAKSRIAICAQNNKIQ